MSDDRCRRLRIAARDWCDGCGDGPTMMPPRYHGVRGCRESEGLRYERRKLRCVLCRAGWGW